MYFTYFDDKEDGSYATQPGNEKITTNTAPGKIKFCFVLRTCE